MNEWIVKIVLRVRIINMLFKIKSIIKSHLKCREIMWFVFTLNLSFVILSKKGESFRKEDELPVIATSAWRTEWWRHETHLYVHPWRPRLQTKTREDSGNSFQVPYKSDFKWEKRTRRLSWNFLPPVEPTKRTKTVYRCVRFISWCSQVWWFCPCCPAIGGKRTPKGFQCFGLCFFSPKSRRLCLFSCSLYMELTG